MYINLINWTDLLTKTEHKVGKEFKADGISEGRMAELLSPFNATGKPIIKYVDKPKAEEKIEEKVEATPKKTTRRTKKVEE